MMAKFLAWLVHLFTASGLLAAFMAILAVDAGEFREAMLWLFLCLLIDGVDGTFARMFRVTEVLPHVKGQTIDYVIDFATYAIIPAYFFYSADMVPAPWNLVLTFVILLVSALYYGLDGMVSEGMHFVGFPVLWNLVVLILYFILDFSPWPTAIFILFFAILHFIPIKFAYPSRARRFKGLILITSGVALICLFMAVWTYPVRPAWVWWGAILSIAVFGVIAIMETYFLSP